ncbi:zinc metalloprotease [Paenibacillus xylanivorans]|uniref:matrixin family metalloprotease n=1 Tax=Paenibacillus xylanivorans TaxID=1705561 RepID=UPI0006B195A1|nr:matrixin family metalloprotease [Paenibacillus xylanivorans]
MKKVKKYLVLPVVLVLSISFSLEASAYKFNDDNNRFFKCSTCETAYPSYSWGDNMGGSSVIKSAWQSAVSDWKNKQSKVEFVYSSSSDSKLHSYHSADKTLYGEMQWTSDLLKFVTKFNGYINNNANNITTTNVARSTANHELAHAMGLDHVSGTSVMNSNRDRATIYLPQTDDVNGINARYPVFKNNVLDELILNKESDFNINNIFVSSDILTFNSLEQMANNADVIVMGHFNNSKGTINMLRDPNNPKEESTLGYQKGLIYDFEIDEIISGNVSETIIDIGLRSDSEYLFTDKEGNEKRISIDNPLFKSPNTSASYILFLSKDTDLDMYFTPFEPFKLIVDSQNKVNVETNLNEFQSSIEKSYEFEDTKEIVNVTSEANYNWIDNISGTDLSDVKNIIKGQRMK